MAATKLSISLSPELAEALDELALRRGEDRSRLIETVLRESPLVRPRIEAARDRSDLTKKGRSPQKLLALARAGRRDWDRRVRRGELRIHDERA